MTGTTRSAASAPPAARTLAARYDAAAARWHGKIARLGYCRAYAELCAAFAGEAQPAGAALRVLDAGAGTGAFAAAFATAFSTAAADANRDPVALELDLLDESPAMLAEAARVLAAAGLWGRALPGRLGARPLAAGAYDVVLCGHLIEHLPDPAAGLATLHAALRPGGLLLLAVSRPHWCTWLLQRIWGHRALPQAAVLSACARAGFAPPRVFAFAEGPPSRTSRGYAALA